MGLLPLTFELSKFQPTQFQATRCLNRMITSKAVWKYCHKRPSLWKKSLHFYLRQNISLSRTHIIPLYWDSSQNIIIFHHDKLILNNEKLSFMLSIRFRLSLDCFKKRQKQKYIKKSPLKKREISLLIIGSRLAE